MNKMTAFVILVVLFAGMASAQNPPPEKNFDQTDGILARA